MKKIVNLCRHPLFVLLEDGKSVRVPAAESSASVDLEDYVVDEVDGISIYRRKATRFHNLPEPEPGTYFVVSRIVADHCRERSDLVAPTDLIKDSKKHVVGCQSFVILGDEPT